MISKSQIQFVKSLTINKFRKTNKLFVAEGLKLLDELANSSYNIEGVYALSSWIDNNRSKFSNETNICEVSVKELSQGRNNQSIET